MKLLFIFITSSLLLTSCYKEDPIIAEIIDSGLQYDTTSNNPIKRYEAIYFHKYGRKFITNPQISDYIYNFQYKNDIYLAPSIQQQDHLQKGIDLMEELFVSFYHDSIIHGHFPNTLIIADTILKGRPENYKEVKWIMTRNTMILSVGKATHSYTKEDKKLISIEMHIKFLCEKLYQYDHFFQPIAFFKLSEDKYGITATKNYSQEELYKEGFVKRKSWGNTTFPSKLEHLSNWLNFLFLHRQDEWDNNPISEEAFQDVIATYPTMKEKKDHLVKAIQSTLGIDDYRQLIYDTTR